MTRTGGRQDIGAPSSPGELLFTGTGLHRAMEASRSAATGRASLAAVLPELAPATLDERPDPAVAWVAGIYALVLLRQPDRAGMLMHAEALRSGTPPTALLEDVMSSAEAVAAGTRRRPDPADVYVTGAYLVGLGRAPDAGGLAAHAAALRAGTSETDLLESFLMSEEARSRPRFPPPPVDALETLVEKVQTVALGTQVNPEVSDWIRDALVRGVPPRRVVRSLARRLRGVTRAGIFAAATARPRAAAAEQAAALAVLREDLLRERAWQWDVHRTTWARLDTLAMLDAEHRSSVPQTEDPGTDPE